MNKQDYRKIEYASKEIFVLKKHEIVTYKLKNYKNVFVSSTCHIKPKGLHIILKNLNEAIKDFGIDDKSVQIIIASFKDGIAGFGMYKAIENEIYLNEIICDKNTLKHEGLKISHVERHEAWHLKQASIYRKQYGIINEDNYSHYLNYINDHAKKYLDSLGVEEDNVGVISEYAYNMYMFGRYDETEAEIKAKKGEFNVSIFTKRYARTT